MIHNASSDVASIVWRNSMECVKWRRWNKKGGRDNILSSCFHFQTSPLQETEFMHDGQVWVTVESAGGILILGLDKVNLHSSRLTWVACDVVYTNASPLFFELMPCTLEALTVIKNVLSLISYSHILENRWKQKSQVSSKNKTKQTQQTTKPKHHKLYKRKSASPLADLRTEVLGLPFQ